MIRRTTMPMLLCMALFVLTTGGLVGPVEAHDLHPGASVRFQASAASELGPGWHLGSVVITGDGCAMVLTPDKNMPGGRRGLGLLFVQKLERRDGVNWIDVPVRPLMNKEPKKCQEAVGG
jgi:hypothetical protein